MSDDETAVRDLVRRWVGAVHAGDLDGVLAGHTEDIVMFDVPPPDDPRDDVLSPLHELSPINAGRVAAAAVALLRRPD